MVHQENRLVTLVKLVDRIPLPELPKRRQRGRPQVYSQRIILKAVVVMMVRHLTTVHELLSVLEEPTSEMQSLRELLSQDGQFPSRRTWQRRLKGIVSHLAACIGCLGRFLVEQIQPWVRQGRAVAMDSTTLQARGGVWHKRQRELGEVPCKTIDTQAHWTKSGWHGWVYGWKLHLATTVGPQWLPLAAELTPANVADSAMAEPLLNEVPLDVRWVLGDHAYRCDEVHALCQQAGRELITPRYGPYPHTDGGAQVRGVFHKLRSVASENFNEQFKGIFDVHGSVPTKGLVATKRFALGAVLVYQLAVLWRFEQSLEPCVGLKAFLKAA